MLGTVLSLSVLVFQVVAQQNGDIRLVGSSSSSSGSGRLEIYLNSQWGTVCDDFFSSSSAEVVCHQLGYSSYSSYGTATDLGYSQGSGLIWLDDVSCSSSSYLHILQCSNNGVGIHNCAHSEDVAVVCSSSRLDDNPYTGQIRLMDGSYPSEGRLEVYCSGEWGTVCDDAFGSNDADTVCRQLGYNDYYLFDIGGFPVGTSGQPIWLDDLPCSSTDVCILDCEICPSGHNCGHSEDVRLICQYNLNTVSSPLPASLDTCNVFSSDDDVTGVIIGVTVGAIVGLMVLVCCIVIGVIVCAQSSKRRAPRRPVTQNVQMTSNTSAAQQPPPSSYPQQPPAANPQFTYPAQYPAQPQAAYPPSAPYPAQVAYPAPATYPAQVPYPVQGQAPYVYPNQPQGGAYPGQVPAPYPVTSGEGDPAPPPPSNPEFQAPPPPSYDDVQKGLNAPYP